MSELQVIGELNILRSGLQVNTNTPKYTDFILLIEDICAHENFIHSCVRRYNKMFVPFNRLRMLSRRTRLTSEQEKRLRILELGIHQEIEATYLFSKILLDRLSTLMEFLFGTCRGMSLKSFDTLVKKHRQYVAGKSLQPMSLRLQTIMHTLSSSVVEYRDKAIVHHYPYGYLRSLMFDINYPKPRQSLSGYFRTRNGYIARFHTSDYPDKVLSNVQRFIHEIFTYFKLNQTCIRL